MIRIDKYLTEQGLVRSRTEAQELILAGAVSVDGAVIRKNSYKVGGSVRVEIDASKVSPYVSRAAYKLLGAFDEWSIDVCGKVALDIGASTGGFTQVLLERGVQKVYAIDVGVGQLATELRNDKRVISLENTDARSLNTELIPEKIDFFVSDVSFISIFKILPYIAPLFAQGAQGVILYKPQFELGPGAVNRHGVVDDIELRTQGLAYSQKKLIELKFDVLGECESPVTGKNGNKEYLLYVQLQ